MKALRTYIAVFLCGCVAFITLYSTQGLLYELSESFAITLMMASWTISATTLAVALVAPFVALVTESFERSQVISIAALLLAVPTFMASQTHIFGALIAMRFIQGMLISVIFAVTVAFIGEQWRAGSVTQITSFYVAGTAVGGFLGRFLTVLITSASNWRYAFEILAAWVAIIGFVIAALLPKCKLDAHPSRQPFVQTMVELLTHQYLWSAFIIGACLLFAQVATFTYIGFRLAAPSFEINTVTLGSIYSVFLLAAFIMPIAGHFTGEKQHSRLLVGAMVIGSLGVALTLMHALAWIIFGLALSVTGIFLAQTAANAFITSVVPTAKTFAIGLYLTFYYLGGSLGAVLPGPLWRRVGWPGCVALIITVQVTAALLCACYWRKSAYPDISS